MDPQRNKVRVKKLDGTSSTCCRVFGLNFDVVINSKCKLTFSFVLYNSCVIATCFSIINSLGYVVVSL